MNIRNVAIASVYIIWVLFIAAIFILQNTHLSESIKNYILLSILLSAFSIEAILFFIVLRCPRCGLSVYARKSKVFGYYYGFTPPRFCARCGLDFTAEKFRFSFDKSSKD